MSCMLEFLCLIFLISISAAFEGNQQQPGLVARVNPSGTQKIFGGIIRSLIGAFPGESFDLDNYYVDEQFIIFYQRYSLNNVEVRPLALSFADNDGLPGVTSSMNFNLTGVQLTGEWRVFIQATEDNILKDDVGNFVAFVPQLTISYETYFRQENGLLRLGVSKCFVTSENLPVLITEFDGLDWQRSAFQGILREQIRNSLCGGLGDLHSDMFAATMQERVTAVGVGVSMDIGIVGNITVDEYGMTLNFLGRCFPENGQDVRYDYMAGILPDLKRGSDRDWQMAGDEYTLKTFLESLHYQGLVAINMTQDLLPPFLSGLLTTKFVSNIVPGLLEYGEKNMMIIMDSTSPPILSLNADGTIGMDGTMGVGFMVIIDDDTMELQMAMYMNAELNAIATPSIKGDRIFSVVTDMSMNMTTGVSNVGEIPIEALNNAMDGMIPFAINSLNNFASEGYPAPSFFNSDFDNLFLEINEGRFEIQADFAPAAPK